MSSRFEVVRTDAAQPWHARFVAGGDLTTWRTENYTRMVGAERAVLSLCRHLGMPVTGMKWNVEGVEKVLLQGTPDHVVGPLVKYVDERAVPDDVSPEGPL